MEQDFKQIREQAKALKQQLENKLLMAESVLSKIEDKDMQKFMREALEEAKAGNLTVDEFLAAYNKQCRK